MVTERVPEGSGLRCTWRISIPTARSAIRVVACLLFVAMLAAGMGRWVLESSTARAAERALAPFSLEVSGTTANLRGVHAVSGEVAWASGASGTVLRTRKSDAAGPVWETCAVAPGAEKLDFRAIWAWDADNAVVMSSGPGGQSRFYKTTDGCSHWKLLYTNPDPAGFWDAMIFTDRNHGTILGDPVGGAFVILISEDGGNHWESGGPLPPRSNAAGEGAFAASNSSLVELPANKGAVDRSVEDGWEFFGTGGKGGPRVLRLTIQGRSVGNAERDGLRIAPSARWDAVPVPLASGTDSAGVFSLAFRDQQRGIAAGGDYQKPNEATGTAAWTADGGKTWAAATKPPHGYRSTVAWDEQDKLWITAGTNGADISEDDGKTWTRIDDGNWNAISLPWIVGPAGRIAKLVSLNLPPRTPQGKSKQPSN